MFKLNLGIICAAGMGTRVRAILGKKSKEMVEVWGKPALQHHLDMMLKLDKFNDVVVVTNSTKRDIIDYMFDNFHRPEQRQLINNEQVVGHTIFTHYETEPLATSLLSKDDIEYRDKPYPRPKKTRVHLLVLNQKYIGQNPIDSMQAAYRSFGLGEFFSRDVFISFADIVYENMAEEMSEQVNKYTVPGLNYISALSKNSKQETLRIENCGRFKIDKPQGGTLDPNHLPITNLTSVLSQTDNIDSCTHMDMGFYYGSARTLFRTAGTWVYDRMITSLLPIHPLFIRSERRVVDLGDPRSYDRDWQPPHSIQHINLNFTVER